MTTRPRVRLSGWLGPVEMPAPRVLAAVQAAYYLASGIWPIVHRASFELVTGKKHDFWLVRTVGGLAVASGASLAVSAARGKRQRETTVLALASGLVFVVADVRAAQGYSRLYLGDALLQIAFAPTWIRRWRTAEPHSAPSQCIFTIEQVRARHRVPPAEPEQPDGPDQPGSSSPVWSALSWFSTAFSAGDF